MRGAVERLRPHNSTLFRLGCLLYTLQCTVQTTMKSGIFAYLCMCVFVCLCIWTFVKLFILCCNVFAVHATFGPLLLGGSRQWNQEVLCLPSLPPLPLCTASRTTSVQSSGDEECSAAVGEVQRKWPHPVPPSSSSYYTWRPLLPVTDLNHQILGPSFLFLTADLYTGRYLSTTLSLIS